MDERVERQVTIVNPLGLHARAAGQLMKLTRKMKCAVTLELEGMEVNAKSLVNVLALGADLGSVITVRCDGEGAREACDAVAELFAVGFYELPGTRPPGSGS